MQIGDYVRTKYGIRKVIQIDNETTSKIRCYVLDKFYNECKICSSNYIYDEHIIKSSPNIIDLIEENDYIRLQDRGDTYYQVVEVPWSRGRNILAIEDRGWDELEEIYDKEEIISVITHEQMKSMEYEVK